MKTIVKLTAALVVALSIVACGGDDDDFPSITPTPTPEPQSVYDVASDSDDFTTLVTAIDAAGLDSTLDDLSAQFTVFAPTNAAFAALGQDAIDALLADTQQLTSVLTYHVLGSVVNAEAAVAAAGTTVATVNGANVGVSLSGDNLFIDNALVTMTDIEADNGVIHVIDVVLMPPAPEGDAPTMNIVETAQANDSFSTLAAALSAADLVDTLADADAQFTVFAPTNAAFEALGAGNVDALLADMDNLTAILTQHVIQGAAVDQVTAYSLSGGNVATIGGDVSLEISLEDRILQFGGADVVMTNIRTTNGIIHVIDTVIVGDAGLPKPDLTIADIVSSNENFSNLLAALVATELDTVLAGADGSFTVFAPTNDALTAEMVEELSGDPDALEDILLYHVIVGGEVLADSARKVAKSSSPMIDMGNMDMATLSLNADDELFINASGVSAVNVMASNGVIHVIDSVLLPPAEKGEPTMDIVETAQMAGGFETLLGALTSVGLDTALGDDSATFTVFAPTDAAFEAIGEAQLASIVADAALLTEILQQHVVAGAEVNSLSAFALNGKSVETLSGNMFDVVADAGVLSFGGANIVTYDIYATNGVIHVIDSVIVGDLELPAPRMSVYDVAAGSDDFETLTMLIDEADLKDTLTAVDATFTVFAPTDDAFAKLSDEDVAALLADTDLLRDVLLYHVFASAAVNAEAAVGLAGDGEIIEMANADNAALSLDGEALLVNTSTVIVADVMADNGIIHAIDTVLMPPSDPGTPSMNIVETAVAAGSFTVLADLLTRVDLVAALSAPDSTFTVFAPTDDAFAKIDQATLDSLTDEQVTAILTQHVISGAAVDSVTAFSLNGTSAQTLSGNDVTIEIVDGALEIQGSTVTSADIYATNGIIHVIDTVILENLMP